MADTLNERAFHRFVAGVAEQTKRFDEMANAMKILAKMNCELTAEEINLLLSGYKNAACSRQATCRILSSLEKDEESGGSKAKLEILKKCRVKIESEISSICSEIIDILENLITSSSGAERAAFYQKMKGDFWWFLADIRSGNEREAAAEKSFRAYKLASTIANDVFYDDHPVRLGLSLNLSALSLEPRHTSEGAKYLAAISELPWKYISLPPHMPDELISKFLVNLTTKMLVSFTVVSKHWRNFIFSDEFSKLHFDYGPNEKGIMHYSRTEKTLRWIEVNRRSEIDKEPTMTLSLLGANMIRDERFNNAVLLSSVRGILFFKRMSEGFLVNPITNELMYLPNPKPPRGDLVGYGFGYDFVNGKFKVVRIWNKRAEVYTVGGGGWKDVVPSPGVFIDNRSMDGSTIGKFCHFSARTQTLGAAPSRVILVFDWESERFHISPCGPGSVDLNLNLKYVVLGNLGGRLGELHHGDGWTVCSVWRQQTSGDAKSWVEIFHERCYVSPLYDQFSVITLLDDGTLLTNMADDKLVILTEDEGLTLGSYRCNDLWAAVEYKPSFFKLELLESKVVEKLVTSPRKE